MADEATPVATPESVVDATATPATPEVADTSLLMAGDETPAPPEVKTDEQTDTSDAKVDEPVVPEHYEISVPEGMELDVEAVAQLEPIFKDLKLSNESANLLVPKLVEMKQAILEGQENARKAVVAGWAASTKADPEIAGANGTEYEKNIKDADLAFKKLTTPALQKAMLETGMVFHPEVVRMFLDFSKMMAEDTHVAGNPIAPTETDRARRMFDKSI